MRRAGWFMLATGLTGALSKTYHYLKVDERRTACGIRLPEFGYFTSQDPYRLRVKLRCVSCIQARRPS